MKMWKLKAAFSCIDLPARLVEAESFAKIHVFAVACLVAF